VLLESGVEKPMLKLPSLVVVMALVGGAQPAQDTLPAAATAKLGASLDAAKPHARHLWREMLMDDDHIVDSKVVVTPLNARSEPLYQTHAFFLGCRGKSGDCQIARQK
jgi:hypothetical protein